MLKKDTPRPFARLLNLEELVVDPVLVLELHPRDRQGDVMLAADHQIVADQGRDVCVEGSVTERLGPPLPGVQESVGELDRTITTAHITFSLDSPLLSIRKCDLIMSEPIVPYRTKNAEAEFMGLCKGIHSLIHAAIRQGITPTEVWLGRRELEIFDAANTTTEANCYASKERSFAGLTVRQSFDNGIRVGVTVSEPHE